MSIIAICRGAKSGGEELAQQLAAKLGYKAISQEIITECAKKYNIMESDLLEKFEETPGLWQRLTNEHRRQLIYIKCALLDAVREDNVIYYGRGGQLFLAGISHVLKLRLEAPRQERVKAVMQSMGLKHDEAIKYIDEIDHSRYRWVKLLYDENWYDSSLYDLTINLQNLSISNICDLISAVIKYEQFQTTEKSLKALNNISLECEIKAAIASDNKIWDQPISISANEGIVTIRGTVKNKAMREIITETVSMVKGVKECFFQMSLLSDPIPDGKYWKE